MHASTDKACFRKLSDWVNSISKHHAASRSTAIVCLSFTKIVACISLKSGLGTERLVAETIAVVRFNVNAQTYGFDRGMFSHQGLQPDLLLQNLRLRQYFRLTSTGAIQQITQQIGT